MWETPKRERTQARERVPSDPRKKTDENPTPKEKKGGRKTITTPKERPRGTQVNPDSISPNNTAFDGSISPLCSHLNDSLRRRAPPREEKV